MSHAASLRLRTAAQQLAFSDERLAVAAALAVFLLAILVAAPQGHWAAEAGLPVPGTAGTVALAEPLPVLARAIAALPARALHAMAGIALILLSWRLSRPVVGARGAVAFAAVLGMSASLQAFDGQLPVGTAALLPGAGAFWLVQRRIGGAGPAALVQAGALLGLAIAVQPGVMAASLGLALVLCAHGRRGDALGLAATAVLAVFAACMAGAASPGILPWLPVPAQPGSGLAPAGPLAGAASPAAWTAALADGAALRDTLARLLRPVASFTGLVTWVPAAMVLAWPGRGGARMLLALRRDLLVLIAAIAVAPALLPWLDPAPRGAGLATYLAALAVALGLERLVAQMPRLALLGFAGLAAAGPVAADLEPPPEPVVPMLRNLLHAVPDNTLHVAGSVEAAAMPALRGDRLLERVTAAPPGANDFLLAYPAETAGLRPACADGGESLAEVVRGRTPPSLAWRVLGATGLAGAVPPGLAAYLRHDATTPVLYRLRC